MARKPLAMTAASLYSVHPAVAYVRSIVANLPETTGRSIDEWVKLVKKSGPAGRDERREWLKKEHKLGMTTAALIADHADGKADEATDPATYLRNAPQYVEAMYAGPKAGLRPIHDALIKLGRSLGHDVKVCPCTTIVPLYRHHVFAQIKPTTRTRIDFGLALKGCTQELSERLVDTGGLSKGHRITHCIRIRSLDDIDAEVNRWARIAYELDAKE